jgi:hypothetical protein
MRSGTVSCHPVVHVEVVDEHPVKVVAANTALEKLRH